MVVWGGGEFQKFKIRVFSRELTGCTWVSQTGGSNLRYLKFGVIS